MTPKLESIAGERVEEAKQRFRAFRLASRTGLIFALLLSMAADMVLLRNASWQAPLTTVQSILLLLSLLFATRADAPAALPSQSQHRSLRRIAALISIFSVSFAVALQKWWIVLVDDADRAAYAGSYRVMGVTLTCGGVALVLGRSRRLARFFAAFAEHPARQTALSFVGIALFGALLLTLPISVRDPSHVSFLDAFFMATSAVCVTGLAVHGVATEYTLWGQCVLLMLVQVGGLGIMVLSASLVVLTGRKLKARSSALLVEVLDADSILSLRGNILRIVGFTLLIEALGTVLLYGLFSRHPQIALGAESAHPMAGSGDLWWAALFHAVSAFCNAGFSLMHAGMEPFVSSYGICSVVMALIILGGLGFPVMSELWQRLVERVRGRRPPRLSLHSRIVLLMTSALVIAVAVALVSVEWQSSLAGLPWHDRLFGALFQSVTLRTAGFNTVDFRAFSDAGLMICMMFMFVGASPGGTGGGIKVTTFAVLFATLRAELRNASEAHLLDRRLPPATVRRAISVAFVAVVVVTFSVLALLLSQRGGAMRLAFEAVSAFGTVGLSAGVTPQLTSTGKIVIIITMLIGRVGPLTVALATAERTQRAHHLHPHERVHIG